MQETFAVWKAGIAGFGKCQNVIVKLGGLGMTSVCSTSRLARCRLRRRSWRGRTSRISRLASLRSAPTAACSRPISRRTASVRPMPSCGTLSNSWLPATRRPTPYRSAGKASVVATLNQNVPDRPCQLPGTPTIPGMSRNPRLSMLRYYKFESISLQRRVRCKLSWMDRRNQRTAPWRRSDRVVAGCKCNVRNGKRDQRPGIAGSATRSATGCATRHGSSIAARRMPGIGQGFGSRPGESS